MSMPRTTAERTTFAAAATIVLWLAGTVCFLWVQPREPATLTVVQLGEARLVDGRSYVTAEVRNTGDETAQAVQVSAELKLGLKVVAEGEQTIDFLSGGESERAVFVFDQVGPGAEVELRAASFSLP